MPALPALRGGNSILLSLWEASILLICLLSHTCARAARASGWKQHLLLHDQVSPTTSFLPDLAQERATSPLFKASGGKEGLF